MLSMTGVRIGWLLGDTQLVESAYARHLYLSYCQPRPLQGAVALLLDKLTPQRVDELQKLYRDKRDRLARTLTAAGFQIGLPAGGHYIMADYSHIAPQMDAHRFSQHMAEHVGSCRWRQVRFIWKAAIAKSDFHSQRRDPFWTRPADVWRQCNGSVHVRCHRNWWWSGRSE